MTTLKQDFATDLCLPFNTDELAETVSYNNGATVSEISAIVDYTVQDKTPGDHAIIHVKKTDVSSPGYRHSFTIDGTVWKITGDKKTGLDDKDNGFILSIPISKGERFSSWRP